VYIFQHRVTYGEIDGQKIAFNAHYLDWSDQATYEFFRKGGFAPALLEKLGFDFVVRKVTIEYFRSVSFDELISFKAIVSHIGKTSYQMIYEIYNELDELVAIITLVHVNVIQNQKTPLPDEVKNCLQGFYLPLDSM
jgi:acyl-CoA thioester hydrolase